MDELRGPACHTANLKAEVVKGIIQGSEFNPKLAKHVQCAALHCFKSQFTQRDQKRVINMSNMLWKIKANNIILSSFPFSSVVNLFVTLSVNTYDALEGSRRKSLCCRRSAARWWMLWSRTRGIHSLHWLLAITEPLGRIAGQFHLSFYFILNKCWKCSLLFPHT